MNNFQGDLSDVSATKTSLMTVHQDMFHPDGKVVVRQDWHVPCKGDDNQ